MPWEPTYTKVELRTALEEARSWREVLGALGIGYHGRNIDSVRRWAGRWSLGTDHLSDHRGRRRLRYSDAELAQAVAASSSWAETLRNLGYCPSGGNWKTVKKRTLELGLSTQHFDPHAASRGRGRRAIPLDQVLVEGSTYSRTSLKRRLFESGLKERRCELCGQGELWRDVRISLILDHANGVRDDNRLENLRIVCPNCAAGLATHCGRKNQIEREPRACKRCGVKFEPRFPDHRYCSQACGSRWERPKRQKRPKARKVDCPPHDVLLHEIEGLGYLAVGRKYGVSDNAIRKWVREYELDLAEAESRDPEAIEIPRRTWPNRRRDAA